MHVAWEWTEPIEVEQWRWLSLEWPALKNHLRFFIKWSFLLSVPLFLAFYWYSPSLLLLKAAGGFACWGILMFIVLTGLAWLSHRMKMQGIHYSVVEKGLHRRGRDDTRLYHWKYIECYRIVKHSHLPGISMLEMKMKRYRGAYTCYGFSQKDEEELRGALANYLPECDSEPL